jgi:type I restriction enzyme S subunit
MSSKFLFGDCAELRSEKVDPKSSQESYYIGLEHIEQQTLSLVGHGYGSDVDSQKQRFYEGDILFGKLRPYFRKVIVAPFDGICSTDIWVVKPRAEVDRNFLFYWMASEEFIASSTYASEGGRMPRAKWDWVCKFQLQHFTFQEQMAIGSILRVLDQKIAVNKALSKTLEDIAQTMFKSWFLDFDPVKAKMAGEKLAGMDAATAALFPNEMEESEVGLIPSGWEFRKVEEVLKRITVKSLPKSTVLLNLGRTLVLEQGDSVIAGFIDVDADVKATNDSPAFVFGDHTCRMRLSTIPFSVFPNTIVLTSEHINTYWAFGATWGLQKFETYRRHWMELAYKVLVVPSTEVADVYGENVKPLFELIDSLMVQNRMLSALRDDLLPRLLSGELQIPEEMLAS